MLTISRKLRMLECTEAADWQVITEPFVPVTKNLFFLDCLNSSDSDIYTDNTLSMLKGMIIVRSEQQIKEQFFWFMRI